MMFTDGPFGSRYEQAKVKRDPASRELSSETVMGVP